MIQADLADKGVARIGMAWSARMSLNSVEGSEWGKIAAGLLAADMSMDRAIVVLKPGTAAPRASEVEQCCRVRVRISRGSGDPTQGTTGVADSIEVALAVCNLGMVAC